MKIILVAGLIGAEILQVVGTGLCEDERACIGLEEASQVVADN